jgi:hypothetical protein
MTNYFFGIEVSPQHEFKGFEYKAIIGYHGPSVEEERVKLIEPEGMTWLNGEQLQFGIRNLPIDKQPLVSNRPKEYKTDALTPENLSYDSDQSKPKSEKRIAVYHPINQTGLLEVLLHGEQRQIRVTLVAEYFDNSGILHDNIAEVVELNIANEEQNTSIAA